MFDALCFPRSLPDDASNPAMLSMPVSVGPHDRTRFLGHGDTLHLNRIRRCGWHLVVHQPPEGPCWTHLYKVVSERGGRVLALLHEAVPGDCGHAPERFSRWPLSVGAQGCDAAGKPGKDAMP